MPRKKKRGRKRRKQTKKQKQKQEERREAKKQEERREAKRQEELASRFAYRPSYIGICADCGRSILSNSTFTFKREIRTYVKVDEETGEEVSRKKEAVIVGMYHFYCGPGGRIMKRWRDESREWTYIREEMLTYKRIWNDSGRRWPAYARPL